MAPRLPPEMLKLVAESLFPFDDDERTLNLDDWEAYAMWPQGLSGTMASLCLASKMFRDFATPVLYRLPVTRKTAKLARTLAERPDLARHVRYLHHDCWNNWYGIEPDEFGPKFTELYEQHVAYIKRRVALGEGGPLEVDPHGLLDDLDNEAEKGKDIHVLDSTAISLCPNLEKLKVSGYYQPVLPSMAPNSLMNLTTVAVSHGDTELAMRFDLLFYLAEAAPNISTLVLQAFADESGGGAEASFPTFPNVTHLRLERSLLDEESFPVLVSAFPLLEDFTYNSGDATVGYGGMNAKQLQDAIVRHAPGLKVLEVDMRQFFAPEGLDEEDVWDSGLAEMQHLESFTMDAASLSPIRDDDRMPFPDGVLVDMLPTCLRRFRIFWQNGSPSINTKEMKDALLRLVGEIPSRFTNLKEVAFLAMDKADDTTEIRAAFEEAGVTLSVQKLLWEG